MKSGARAGQSHYEKFHFRVPKPFYPLGLHSQRGRGPCAPSKARAIPEPTQGGSRWHPVCPRQLSGNSQQYSASTLEPEGSSAPSGAGQPLSQQIGWWRGRIQFVLSVCLPSFKAPMVLPHLHPRTHTGGRSWGRLISLPDSPGKRSLSCPLSVLLSGIVQD